jgi:hypothetical protein
VQHPNNFFSPGEYIIADSGYPATLQVVPMFKLVTRNAVGDKKRFNDAAASVRVKVEHAFGILKSRFTSLQGL